MNNIIIKNRKKNIIEHLDKRSRYGFFKKLARDRYLVLLTIPVVLGFTIFSYIPLYGVLIAFRDFSPGLSYFDFSKWVGLDNFARFFESIYAFRIIRNTFLLNIFSIIFGFPVPIIFALFLNEIRNSLFKRVSQTISYLPHFISTVIIVGLITTMLSSEGGIVNDYVYAVTGNKIEFFLDPKYFRFIYIGSDIWQSFGWGSIIYLGAISGIDILLYEVARIDGASRLQQIRHITIPGILPTISIILILNLAGLFSGGLDKTLLLYNPAIYETADLISTYVYRIGIVEGSFSFGTAIGLMNSLVALLLLYIFNRIAKKLEMATFW